MVEPASGAGVSVRGQPSQAGRPLRWKAGGAGAGAGAGEPVEWVGGVGVEVDTLGRARGGAACCFLGG